MSKNLDEFKQFVKRHPSLKLEVSEKRKTWQSLYENWYILGEDDPMWKDFKENTSKENEVPIQNTSQITTQTTDTIKNVLGYLKKINPDTITKTLSTAQKAISIFSGFSQGSNKLGGSKQTGDPLFDKRFDDWY